MSDADALRRMVREVLREVLPHDAVTPAPVAAAPEVRRVAVRDDRDLADLVTQVLNLAQDPDRAADLRAGRIRFALATDDASAGPVSAAAIEVERGALTERLVQRAAREGRALQLGPRAVVTPLARDRARALGVTIHRTEGHQPQRGETR
jgi:hypothetical protein